MILAQRPESDARAIAQPQSAPFRLSLWHFEPLLPPDPFHALVVHLSAFDTQQVRDPTISVATEPARQPHHVRASRRFIPPSPLHPALRRAWLAQRTARVTLTRPQSLTYIHHTPASTLGAQKFPLAASLGREVTFV